jgi:hypothetical protein
VVRAGTLLRTVPPNPSIKRLPVVGVVNKRYQEASPEASLIPFVSIISPSRTDSLLRLRILLYPHRQPPIVPSRVPMIDTPYILTTGIRMLPVGRLPP